MCNKHYHKLFKHKNVKQQPQQQQQPTSQSPVLIMPSSSYNLTRAMTPQQPPSASNTPTYTTLHTPQKEDFMSMGSVDSNFQYPAMSFGSISTLNVPCIQSKHQSPVSLTLSSRKSTINKHHTGTSKFRAITTKRACINQKSNQKRSRCPLPSHPALIRPFSGPPSVPKTK